MDFNGLKDIYNTSGTRLVDKVGNIYWVAQLICYAAAVIILMIKGYKFMKASPDAKAEVKKELVSYAIGALLLFGVGTLISIVGNIAQGI